MYPHNVTCSRKGHIVTGTMIHLSGRAPDTKWDTDDPASVEKTKKEFNRIVNEEKGRVGNQATGERLTTFDPSVAVMEHISPMAGG